MKMPLNCPAQVVYHTSPKQKLEAKNAVRKYKFGSPKIRDILREKCKARIKEARKTSFDNSRGIGNNQQLIKSFLREEVAELEADLRLQELIYQEMMQEVHEWIVEDYEKQENYLIDGMDEESVFCPVCQKYCLESTMKSEFRCSCGVSFSYHDTLKNFHTEIQSALRVHEQTCDQNLTFFVEPGENNNKKLCTLCKYCDYFYPF